MVKKTAQSKKQKMIKIIRVLRYTWRGGGEGDYVANVKCKRATWRR